MFHGTAIATESDANPAKIGRSDVRADFYFLVYPEKSDEHQRAPRKGPCPGST